MASTAANASRFLADEAPPLCSLNVASAFNQLSEREKLYAHCVGEVSPGTIDM